MYTCELCNYSTTVKCNFDKHMNSKKHLMLFTQNRKAITGEKRRVRNLTIKNQNTVNQMLEEKENQCKLIIDENKELKTCVRLLSNMVQISMSKAKDTYLSLVQKHSLANGLEPISEVFELENKYKTLEDFAYDMVTEYRDDTFVQYITNFIVTKYKCDDPRFQSIFTCDPSRHNYKILRDNNDKMCPFVWDDDKNGIMTRQTVINPILNYIKVKVASYYDIAHYNKIMNNITKKESEDDLDLHMLSMELIKNINSGDMATKILHCLSPELFLSNNQKQFITKHNGGHQQIFS